MGRRDIHTLYIRANWWQDKRASVLGKRWSSQVGEEMGVQELQ